MHAPFRPATSYNVAVGASAAQSATPVPIGVHAVRLVSTTACFVEFGTAPVADVVTNMLLAPNWPEVFRIRPGEKVSVIQSAAAGTLNITELTF